MKQKVVTKEQIINVLFEGGKIHWSQMDAKATLLELDKQTNRYVTLGTIKFNTFIQLDLREIEMKLPFWDENYSINDAASPFMRLRRPDAWCGYDEYQLKPKVLELLKQGTEYVNYYKERIWR